MYKLKLNVADGKNELHPPSTRDPPSQNAQMRAGGIFRAECNAENKDRGYCASEVDLDGGENGPIPMHSPPSSVT